MISFTLRRLTPVLLTTALFATAAVGCGDDDSTASDAGASGTGSSGKSGSSGSGGKGGSGTAGKSGSGASAGKGGSGGTAGASDTDGGTGTADVNIGSKAADLRVTLNLLLSEHLIFAAKATGAALDGRMDEYTAYGDLLGKNGTDIGDLVGAAFGDDAKNSFNTIWSAHNGYFVDYTTAVAAKDMAKQTAAVTNLTTKYVPMFAALISSATGLDNKTVTDLTTQHVLTTKAIVDAQGKKDWPGTYAAIRTAFAHMQMIGDPLAEAIAKKKSSDFPGDSTTKSVDFRVALNQLLQEHLYLATFATNDALGGRTDEFTAAGDKLNDNGTDLGNAIGSIYGDDAKTTFNGIWSAHNGYFVDYTTGVAKKDAAMQSTAVDNLTKKYVPMFSMFLAGATDLPEATLESLVTDHVLMTKAVVDAQAKTDWTTTGAADRMAAQHMEMIGDPLSTAIVAKMPGKF